MNVLHPLRCVMATAAAISRFSTTVHSLVNPQGTQHARPGLR